MGPFQVMIESEKKNIGNYHHLSIAKNILELKFEGVKKINRKGINRLCIEFSNWEQANRFCDSEALSEKGYNMFIPRHLVTCRGIVKYIDKDISEEELKIVTDTHSIEILECRRLKHRCVDKETNQTTYEPTGTVLYTFSGKLIPREVLIFGVPMLVEPYIIPVIQCFRCLLFGHTKRQCRGKLRCHNCAEPHEEVECLKVRKCLHCRSDEHKSTSRICPEYDRQRQLRQLMCFENISFYDANIRIPKPKPQRGFYPRNEQFPSIIQGAGLSNTQVNVSDHLITVENRQINTPIKRTYAYSTQKSVKKLRESKNMGYDRAAHEACLIKTIGSNQRGSMLNINNIPSNSRATSSSHSPEAGNTQPHDRDLMGEFREILKSVNSMGNEQKREIIQRLKLILKANKSSLDNDASVSLSTDEGEFSEF